MNQHRVQEMMRLMASRIDAIACHISDEEVSRFINELMSARRREIWSCCKSICYASDASGYDELCGW